jgi:serine/threonine protein kinase
MEIRIDCISEYGVLQKIGRGTFSSVYKVRRISTGEIFAMKVIKEKIPNIEAVRNIDEIKYMTLIGSHPNIVQLYDVIYEPKILRLSLIFDYMDFDLLRLFSTPSFYHEDILHYAYQLIYGLGFIHSAVFVHCDIKPENIMINLRSRELKIGDLGSMQKGPCSNKNGVYICTRWYRAPELLLKCKRFDGAVDIWSAGCVIAEMIMKKPIFPGRDTMHQLQLIHDTLHRVPSQEQLNEMETNPKYTADMFKLSDPQLPGIRERLSCFCDNSELIDAVEKMLVYDPTRRITAQELLALNIFDSNANSRKITRSSKMLVRSANDVGFQASQQSFVPAEIALQEDMTHEAPITKKRSCVTFAKIFKPKGGQRRLIALQEKMPKNKSCFRLDPL